ncbi:MAG: ATP-binding protein [Bifidobacteriaceae bacterium]|nr:ATP-binding protein [Bifidobacteriaceae bacterium]
MNDKLLRRNVLDVALERVNETPVLLLQGARSVGKSTLMRELSDKRNARILDFDDEAIAEHAEQNMQSLLTSAKTVFIDEYQKVPSVLNAVKVKLNQSSRFGQFVLSGSISFDALPHKTQALTGRIQRLNVLPLTQTEINKKPHRNFIKRLVDSPQSVIETYMNKGVTSANRNDYLKKTAIGGFPMALKQNNSSARTRWFESYIDYSINRDVREVSRIRQLSEMELLLHRLAKTNASLLNVANISKETGLNPHSARDYILLLEKIFMLHRLPVSTAVATKRLVKQPKLHFADTGIATTLLELDETTITNIDATTLSATGHLYETFAVNEVIRLCQSVDKVRKVTYWRTRDGLELDLILELRGGKVIAIEIKSAEKLTNADYTPMRYYQKLAGDKFLYGIILHSGVGGILHKNNIASLPLDCLWH